MTTIVPVLDGGERLGRLVAALAAEGPVIVVDDGSRDGSAERAAAGRGAGPPPRRRRAGRRRRATPGSRAARDRAGRLRRRRLRGRAGLAPRAGRRCSPPTPSWRWSRRGCGARPATRRSPATRSRGSPLDLGPHASLVGPGRRVAYLPAAALLARRDALLELGGFDESMRFGEDVDLVWRLLARGPAGPLRAEPRGPPPAAPDASPRSPASGPATAARRPSWSAATAPPPRRCGRAATAPRSGARAALLGPRAAASRPSPRRPRSSPAAAPIAQSRQALAEVALRGQAATRRATSPASCCASGCRSALAAAPFSRRARGALLAAADRRLLSVLGGELRSGRPGSPDRPADGRPLRLCPGSVAGSHPIARAGGADPTEATLGPTVRRSPRSGS